MNNSLNIATVTYLFNGQTLLSTDTVVCKQNEMYPSLCSLLLVLLLMVCLLVTVVYWLKTLTLQTADSSITSMPSVSTSEEGTFTMLCTRTKVRGSVLRYCAKSIFQLVNKNDKILFLHVTSDSTIRYGWLIYAHVGKLLPKKPITR